MERTIREDWGNQPETLWASFTADQGRLRILHSWIVSSFFSDQFCWFGRYEGTVECMTREEWEGQAKALWADLTDERGRLRICRDAERRLNTNSIEGAAQATLETVYGAATLRLA